MLSGMSVLVWGLVGCVGLRGAQQAVVAHPNDPQAWVDLGDAYRRKMRREAAQEAYGHALTLDPQNEAAQARMANAHRRAGTNEVVRMALEEPSNDELWGDAADYYVSVGMISEAISAYSHAFMLDPTDSEWQSALMTHVGVDHMVTIMNENMQTFGDEGIGDVADMLASSGRREEACALYEQALSMDPSDEEWRQRVSECTGSVAQGSGAQGSGGNGMGTASSTDTSSVDVLRSRVFSNPELLRELGVAHAQSGDMTKAEEYLHSALLLEPSNNTSIETYVAITGRTRLDVLEQLAEEVVDDDELLGEVGDQLLSLGRREEALRYYSRALELDTDDPEWLSKTALLKQALRR